MLWSACCKISLNDELHMAMATPLCWLQMLRPSVHSCRSACMRGACRVPALTWTLIQEHTFGTGAAITLAQACSRENLYPAPAVNVPMFPRELSEGLFSLQQGRQCCTLSVSVVLGPDGDVEEQSLTTATIIPSRRVPYDQADELLQTTLEHEEPELHALRQASRAPKLGVWFLLSVWPGAHAADAGCQ